MFFKMIIYWENRVPTDLDILWWVIRVQMISQCKLLPQAQWNIKGQLGLIPTSFDSYLNPIPTRDYAHIGMFQPNFKLFRLNLKSSLEPNTGPVEHRETVGIHPNYLLTVTLTLIGMREGTFHSLVFFLDYLDFVSWFFFHWNISF